MGEAKQRKQNEPDFGTVPKKPSYRGLVVSPPLEIKGTSIFAKSSNLDPQELRFSLLFWDKLVWPSSRNIHFGSGQDEAYLEEARILTRPDYTFDGDGASGIVKGQLKAFQDRDQSEPGVWALSQGENSFNWKDGAESKISGALVELHHAVPIPSHDIPLAEILEFKQRRSDELMNFRLKLETFLAQIEGATNQENAFNACKSEIDHACADLLIVGKEWQFPMYVTDFKASFTLNPARMAGAGSLFAQGAIAFGLPTAATVAAAATGAVLSIVDVKPSNVGFRSPKLPASPYKYAYNIHKELS